MLRSDRRAASGDALADAFLGADGPLCFDDLAKIETDVAELAAWLGHAVHEGIVEEIPGGSSRCFRLKARGRRVLTLRRRSEAAVRPAEAV